MPGQGEYFGGNGGYQRQPVNGGYNGNVNGSGNVSNSSNGSYGSYGSNGTFPTNPPPQAAQAMQSAQAAQTAYARRAGTFPYSRPNRPNGFVNGNGGYVNAAEQSAVNFPTNSGIRQYQSNGQGGQVSSGNYRNNFGNRNSPFTNNFPRSRPAPPPEPENIPEPTLSVPEENAGETDSKKSSLLSLLDGIKVDPEKATLVLLIVILARNGADITLIMALAYLLM